LSKEFTSTDFQVKMQNAVAHPDGKDAKYVIRKLLPVLTTAGKNTSFGRWRETQRWERHMP
jgi:hypothetical protein